MSTKTLEEKDEQTGTPAPGTSNKRPTRILQKRVETGLLAVSPSYGSAEEERRHDTCAVPSAIVPVSGPLFAEGLCSELLGCQIMGEAARAPGPHRGWQYLQAFHVAFPIHGCRVHHSIGANIVQRAGAILVWPTGMANWYGQLAMLANLTHGKGLQPVLLFSLAQ